MGETANDNDHGITDKLKSAVEDVQDKIDGNFNKQLLSLAPAFEFFGYPGLSDPRFKTEIVLKVEQLLSNHTTVGYEGIDKVNLPESYRGLDPRNLIFNC
uniref:Uncharacterized protein n=1 Tax=Candidatus Kentrum sp. TUN TaxID=2126343 RepID=A0A451A7R6_9GAMM|nr:MAG: hypothetical protein BECKTUN1418F_GA0071002_10771 [Candidatus Kentron sp. TUN]VFK62086.1 MAG: hypothetical protein BECKTUN1418E_GA0071001_10741 [Candidatus Kentron sp. TUN]VFK64911.1 MAG: hypothetical protein BECKTUN1418D_GA0071000_12982 [Candidatus Kentron sp. TUN]